MSIFRAGLYYFALVFGAGFILGTVRELLITPHFGRALSILVEAPFMLLAIYVSTCLVLKHIRINRTSISHISIGLIGFILILFSDFTIGVKMRNISVHEQLNHFIDPAGIIYLGLLLVFTTMPFLIWKLNKL